MGIIKYKFNILYTGHKFHTQYTELKNGKYGKTFVKDGVVEVEMIDLQEYASALAHILLRDSPQKITTVIE